MIARLLNQEKLKRNENIVLMNNKLSEYVPLKYRTKQVIFC